MRTKKLGLRVLLMAILLFLGACVAGPKQMNNVSLLTGDDASTADYGRRSAPVMVGNVESGLLVPDGSGGVVMLPGTSPRQQNSGYVDARELKLKVRELGDQLVAGMKDCSLQGSVAMPASFVDVNDFSKSSPLGRYIAEQLYYELNQRGYPVREYRMSNSIRLKEKAGEFALSRSLGKITAKYPDSVVIVGTYHYDKDAIFVNARLVIPKSGRVVRTASLVLENNELTRRMGRGSKTLPESSMRIRDFRSATRSGSPANLSPFDRGEDIH